MRCGWSKNNTNFAGAEDLKGHVMKLRGDMMRSNRNCELEALGIQVIIEQAAHELKYGDARVSALNLIFIFFVNLCFFIDPHWEIKEIFY